MNKRYKELDSLRGIAALCVALSHTFLTIPNFFITNDLNNTLLHIIWDGHAAVILFFLLSGFVLSLPYISNNYPKYRVYIIRRIFRIYFPYIVSILVGTILMYLFINDKIRGLNSWFYTIWVTPPDLKSIINQIIFLGDYKNSINFVTWSLNHEMRISIIFPLIMLIVFRFNWKFVMVTCLSLSFFYYTIDVYANLHGYIDKYDNAFFRTIHYVSIFILGSLLAKNLNKFFNYWTSKSKIVKLFLLIIGVLCYEYSSWCFPNIRFIHLEFINDWVTSIGGCIFIVASLFTEKISNILLSIPVSFLGKISYSFYLYHGMILFASIYALYKLLPLWIILIFVFIISILIATCSYYFVEKPSIRLGKHLTKTKDRILSNEETTA